MVIDWFESNRLFKARNYDQLAKCCEAGGVGESGPQDPLTHINFFFWVGGGNKPSILAKKCHIYQYRPVKKLVN